MDEQRHLKKRLEFSEARFEAIAQTATDSIVISNENSLIVFANKKTYEIFGYQEGELIGLNLHVLMPEKYRKAHSAGVDRFIQSGVPKLIGHTVEIEGLRKDGSVFPLELSLSCWQEEKHYFFSGIIRDITKRKEQEKSLQDTNEELATALEELQSAQEQLTELNHALEKKVEERTLELAASEEEIRQTLDKTIELNKALAERENFLSSIIDQTPVSTWIADAEGTLISANEACMKLFGVEDASLGIGKYNILKDELLKDQPFYQNIQAVFREGKVAKFSGWYNLSKVKHVNIPSHKTVYLIATVFPIKNADGKVTHAVVQHEDITERMRSEEALHKSEVQLRMITDALPVLISYINNKQEFAFVNKAYTSWFGKSKEEVLGSQVSEILGEAAYANVKEKVEQALSGEEVRFEGYMPYRFGEARHTMTHLVPHQVDGKVIGFFALVSDVSSLRKVQAELGKKNSELIRINTDLDNFIYTASHDLKSPIANMEGLMGMMRQALLPKLEAREHKMFDMMSLSIEKLKDTINHLSDVTKIAKNLDQQTEEINIQEIVEDVKSDIQHFIEQVQPVIKEQYKVERIRIGKANFRSIVYNLLSNALKYHSPDRSLQIKINTYEEGDSFVFSVQDNGLGLSAAQQGKLFTMFKRLHTHVEGTGIGLYIIKRIVENMQGNVVVESNLNQGSTFKVIIPKVESYSK